jgi:hypothetical protein
MFGSAFLQDRHVHTIAVGEFSDPFSWSNGMRMRTPDYAESANVQIGRADDRGV